MAAFPLQCIDQPLLPCFGTIFDAASCVINNYESSSKAAGFSNNESILSNKCGDDSSMSVVESYNNNNNNNKVVVEFGEQVTQIRKVMKKMDQKKRINNIGVGSSSSSQYMGGNEVKRKRQKKTTSVQNQNKEMKVEKALDKKEETKISEEAPIEYVHVRARRGQATDSHSLAERVRREKIREKMKILQGLVPGCDKVTGKALMLDEIINYVQSLQNQVEFLSMKAASLSPFFELATESDSFILTPEAERVNAEPPIISDTFTGLLTAPEDNYPLLNHIATSSLSFDPHVLRPSYTLTQDDGQALWDVISGHQGQKFDNEFGFMTNNLCSFPLN